MFAVPLGRIVWKEYRANRTLWLACAGIGWFLEILISNIVLGEHERTSMMSGVPGILGFCYAAACSALMFAGEREERTSHWMLSLSVPPGTAVVGKLGFAVLSIIALQLVIAIPALIQMTTIKFRPIELQFLLIPSSLVVLIWTLLGSLTSRRVLVSIGSMVFWWIATLLVPLFCLQLIWPPYFEESRNQFWVSLIVIFVMAGTFVADIWLAWRWSKGQYLDGSLVERGYQWCGRWMAQFIPTRSSREAGIGRIEHEQSWRRTWQRLVWQEKKRESLHYLALVGGCGFALWMSIHAMHTQAISNVLVAYLLFVPMAMGLFAFESTREKSQALFLVGRGVSPTAVWLAKHAVWLPRAFWITGAIFGLGLMAERGSGAPIHVFKRMLDHSGSAVCFVLMSYGCGQLAATLLRSPILAGVLGGALALLVAGWQALTYRSGLPLGLLWGIPLVVFPLISLWQMRPRMLDDQSWARRFRLVGVVLALPLVMCMLFSIYRVAEVRAFTPLEPVTAVRTNPWSSQNWNAWLSQRPAARALSEDEHQVRTGLLALIQSRLEPPERADQATELLSGDINSLQLQSHYGKSSVDLSRSFDSLSTVMQVRAREYMREGERGKSFQCLLGSLKLARLLAQQQDLEGFWMRYSVSQFSILESFVEWANYPFQTPESLRESIRLVESELKRFPFATEAIIETYVQDTKVLDSLSFESINEYLQEKDHLITHSSSELVAAMYLPWEMHRLKTLMGRETLFLHENAWKFESQPTDPTVEAVYESTVRNRNAQMRGGDLFFPAYEARGRIREIILQRQTEIRAALVRMELIAYRLEHQRLPSTLIELIETGESKNLIDPWSNRLFEYGPAYLLSAGATGVSIQPVPARIEIRNRDTFFGAYTPEQLLNPDSFAELKVSTGTPSVLSGQLTLARSLFPIPPATRGTVEP